MFFANSIIMLRKQDKSDLRPEGDKHGRRLVIPCIGVVYVDRKAGPGII
jgi:hypothetical protein